ncbi:MAG TPA: CapA family protein [Actinoplanes sp.]|nr:CapA family protein [Actinoplanes sp.]
MALAGRDTGQSDALWQEPAALVSATVTGPLPSAQPSAAAATEETRTLSATGDIIMGSVPDRMPRRGGAGFFDAVTSSLSADLVMGNLEQPLTGDTGTSKCRREGPPATPGGPPTVVQAPNCFAFRAPPAYAEHLKDAGFDLLNTANNHARDFGPAGYRNTRKALDKYDLAYTGSTDEITVVDVEGVQVAVVGFSSYAGANSLVDLSQARRVIRKATEQADVVVVQVHMGAEGSDKGHVKPGTEIYFGENRGDPMKFARAVIDVGADLVVGHGPHVLRGMEFYRGRLIAYSLGNFAGGGNTLSNGGILKYGGILKVSLTSNGTWSSGQFVATAMNSAGLPTVDAKGNGRRLVAQLSAADFGDSAAVIGADGSISPPA